MRQGYECIGLFCTYCSIGSGRDGVLERVHQILSCHNCRVGGRRGQHVVVMGEKFDCACNAFFACLSYVSAMATILFGGSDEIPSVHTMCCPSSASIGGLMHKNFGAGWRKRRFVVIKGAVECGFC